MWLSLDFLKQNLSDIYHLSAWIKLLFAALLGGMIGFERESKRKPVGIKTCIIIAVTTCILTTVSIHSADITPLFLTISVQTQCGLLLK